MGMTDEEYADTLAIADRMELRRLELDKERDKLEVSERYSLQREKENTKQARAEGAMYVGIALAVAVAICVVAWIIWQANKGPSADDEIQKEFKVECVKAGSTYVDGQCIGRDTRVDSDPGYEEPTS